MTTYTEYKALMFRNGKWESAKQWHGAIIATYKDKDDCVNAIAAAVEKWKKQAPDKPLPEKWTILYRKVTVTDWLEYADCIFNSGGK